MFVGVRQRHVRVMEGYKSTLAHPPHMPGAARRRALRQRAARDDRTCTVSLPGGIGALVLAHPLLPPLL